MAVERSISFSPKIRIYFWKLKFVFGHKGKEEDKDHFSPKAYGHFRTWGGRWPYCPKKNYTMPESVSVVQTHSNRRKTKTLTMLTSNETVIIPKIVTWNLAYPIYFDWRPSQKSQKIIKETVNSFTYEKFKKNFKTALFRTTAKSLQLVFVCFDSFAIVLLMKIISISCIATIHI